MAPHAGALGRLRWIGSIALLATSIWTGMAGGFGLYTRQVGVARAWMAVAVAFAAVESGKLFPPRHAHHPAKKAHPANLPAAQTAPVASKS